MAQVNFLLQNTVHETSDDQTVGAYHDLSQVASEEIVGEQELSSEPSANLTVNHKEGRSSEIMDNIKIEPQFADVWTLFTCLIVPFTG